jgi:hypothetical protein
MTLDKPINLGGGDKAPKNHRVLAVPLMQLFGSVFVDEAI